MAEDSGRLREECAPAHTGSGRRLSATSYRVAKRSSDRSSARSPCPQVLQRHLSVAKGSSICPWHGDPAYKHLSGIPTWQSVLLTRLRHGDPALRCLSGILAWRRVHLSALRHGHPAYRYLSGILVWRRGLLSALWHGDPLLKHFWGRVACQRKGNRYP